MAIERDKQPSEPRNGGGHKRAEEEQRRQDEQALIGADAFKTYR